ncbi:MAG: bifunctional 3,4-dihydroxy-2-butanone-4-phosphate synthase/GTP cyclohydrolase II [Acidimicrobiia bacterium]|nr:bifunctional 3,4-dihydroxy-2-butanone-4-phosphate synthase/GTP cyclohydrolase II [Acidimicrobiia bacterium]
MSRQNVEAAIAAIANGDFVLVVDDEDRENEGDLIIAAEKATPEKIAFMVRYTSGLICAPLEGTRLDELALPLMVLENTDSHKTAFTVSVDYVPGTSTGISAADRAITLRAMADPATRPTDLARPGHIFPLRYCEGGVLVRPGHTEAAVDLARMAGLRPAGALCEIVNDDGTMSRGRDLNDFAAEHGIPVLTIEELVAYRWATEALVTREVETTLPTLHGEFKAYGYRAEVGEPEQVALVMGEVAGKSDVLVRVHSECLTGDVLGSLRCDCGGQLQESMAQIAEAGEGVVIYVRGHEGRGIGLLPKLHAYKLQDNGADTVDANLELGLAVDARHYGPAAQILNDLKVASVSLLTNNPTKVEELQKLGVEVSGRTPLAVIPTDVSKDYLETKATRMGHLLSSPSDQD